MKQKYFFVDEYYKSEIEKENDSILSLSITCKLPLIIFVYYRLKKK